MTRTKFKTWEFVLICFSVLLVAGAAFFVFSDQKIYPLLLGIKDTSSKGVLIGKLQKEVGQVKRQPIESASFKIVHQNENLMNEDMLITGGDSSATVVLEDGATIELGPNTMARLSFDQQLGLGGISRNASIDIVAGNVKASAKNGSLTLKSIAGGIVKIAKNESQQIKVDQTPTVKPKPKIQEVKAESQTAENNAIPLPSPIASPSPIAALSTATPAETPAPTEVQASFIFPLENAKLELPKNSKKFTYLLTVKAEISSDQLPVKLILQKKSKATPILNKTAKAVDRFITEEVVLTSPGKYKLKLEREDGQPWETNNNKTEIEFTLSDELEGLLLNPVLIGGKPIEIAKSDEQLLKKFEITFSWIPVPGATEYSFILLGSGQNKPFIEKTIPESSFVYSKGQVFAGSFRYQVTARLPGGFKVKSKWDTLEFSLKNPVITSPENGANFTPGETALLIWTKTSFAEFYELEIFGDENLKSSLLKTKVKANFFSVKNLKPGTYYWRVRSASSTVASANSAISKFTVK